MVDATLVRQYYAGICVNIISISFGAFCGWPSASFLELQADDSPLSTGPMSNADAGLVAATLCMGGLLGTVFFSWCADAIGRKRCLLLIAVPSLVAWAIILVARTPLHLCVSRFFGGVAGGGSYAVIPIYVTEFSDIRIRGTLGAFIVLSCNIGILVAFILGNFFSYRVAALLMSLLPVTFLALFSFLPETPQYLMKREQFEAAAKALRYFRNFGHLSEKSKVELDQELEQMKVKDDPDAEEETRISWKDINDRVARKAFVLGVALMLLNQLCGCFAMINYTASIFKQSNSSLSPNMSAIIVGFIQLLGSYAATVLVERAGRKVLLAVSAIGTSLGLTMLGVYNWLAMLGYNVTRFTWVPVASFSFTIFIACVGVMTLPFLVVSEIMPPKIRNLGNMVCMSLLWIIGFFLIMFFPTMVSVFGMHGIMFFFAANSLAGAIFVMLRLPETKGKTIEAILSSL